MNINPKIAIVLHQTVFNDDGTFPKILHEDPIMHIVRNTTILQLDRHGKFLEEKYGVRDQILRLFRTGNKNSPTLIALDCTSIHDKACVKKTDPKSVFRVFKLTVLDREYILFVRFVVNAMKFAIIHLIFLKFVSINLHVCQGQILDEQTLFFVPVDKVFRKIDLQIVRRILVSLYFYTAVVVVPKIILDDFYNTRNVLLCR